jgi:hypothetical protein
MQANQLLVVLLLGGLLGMCGQGIRVIAGLKKGYDKAADAGQNFKDHFDPKSLVVSLFIGFTAGVLGVLALWGKINPNNLQSETIMALLGAGYGGADFIEAFMSRTQAAAMPNTTTADTSVATTAASSTASAAIAQCDPNSASMPEPSAPPQPFDPAVG